MLSSYLGTETTIRLYDIIYRTVRPIIHNVGDYGWAWPLNKEEQQDEVFLEKFGPQDTVVRVKDLADDAKIYVGYTDQGPRYDKISAETSYRNKVLRTTISINFAWLQDNNQTKTYVEELKTFIDYGMDKIEKNLKKSLDEKFDKLVDDTLLIRIRYTHLTIDTPADKHDDKISLIVQISLSITNARPPFVPLEKQLHVSEKANH